HPPGARGMLGIARSVSDEAVHQEGISAVQNKRKEVKWCGVQPEQALAGPVYNLHEWAVEPDGAWVEETQHVTHGMDMGPGQQHEVVRQEVGVQVGNEHEQPTCDEKSGGPIGPERST